MKSGEIYLNAVEYGGKWWNVLDCGGKWRNVSECFGIWWIVLKVVEFCRMCASS